MGKIYTIGEALIDFIPVQTAASLSAVDAFQKRPGGAPANVAVAAAKASLNRASESHVVDAKPGELSMSRLKRG